MIFHRRRDPVPRELAAWERQVRDALGYGIRPDHPWTKEPIESPRTVVAVEGMAQGGFGATIGETRRGSVRHDA